MESQNESNHRSALFFACLLLGLLLIVPAVHLHHWLVQIFERGGHPFPAWFRDFTGFLFAVSPIAYIAFKTTRYLNRCYPDSPARRIPEPYERPSANKR